MFTDMAGYGALSRTDAAKALRLLNEHFSLVRSVVPNYRGRVVKTTGDAFLIAFDSVPEALDCAVAVQHQHAARNRAVPPEARFEIRIGVHLSDVQPRGSGAAGDGVNIAARMERMEHLAPPGGLAVSAEVHAQVHGELARRFRSLGPQTLDNIPAPLEVFVLDAAALPPISNQRPTALRRFRWLIVAAVAAAVLAIVAIL